MKLSGFIIITSLLLSALLIAIGGYLTVDNLIHPKGNLFEGVTLLSMGMLLGVMLVIANSIGNVITLFKNVYVNQVEMQQQMIEHIQEVQKLSKPMTLGDILGKMGPNSMTITDLNTGETTSAPIGSNESFNKLNELILNAINKKGGNQKKELSEMTREELEEELAKAVKKDDFERAAEIKQIIKSLDKKDNSEDDSKES
jgi:hypothetical protein